METIIQQIAVELVKKITKKAYSDKIRDIDALSSEVLMDCKEAATSIIEAICYEINLSIREDKVGRKECGMLLKQKDRPREILTEIGKLNLPRDYYYDKKNQRYISILDKIIGIQSYERVGGALSAKLVSLAAEMSYAKSSDIAIDGAVSRQTVKNHIRKINTPEKQVQVSEKKKIKELHVYADEDHVHMQKANKQRGKSNKILPLVTVTEGVCTEGTRRNRTIGTMHFVDENLDSKSLWKSVEGYIDKKYDIGELEKIYVHGDGGGWIKNGLENFQQTVHVMDGYHLGKRIRALSIKFPKSNVKQRLNLAITSNDKKRADEILHKLYDSAENPAQINSVSEFGKYLMGNWNEIVSRKNLDIPGSCTEAQISHILSERFSRNPMGWSKEGLGKLSKIRVYMKNGGKITSDDFRNRNETKYSEYADKIIEEVKSETLDWSLFDGKEFVFDSASGTQITIHDIGSERNIFWS